MAEEEDFGGITWQDYKNFLSFGAGNWGIFFYLLISLIAAVSQLGSSWWLGKWTSAELEEQ